MSQYIILIDERDTEKFRQFQIGKFNSATREFLDKENLQFIWGFHKSIMPDSIWKQIKKNDYVLFTVPKNNFKIAAQVSKKILDKGLGNNLFPENLNSEQIHYFLLFDKLLETNKLFYETIDYSTTKIDVLFAGIYQLKNDFKIKPYQIKIPFGDNCSNESTLKKTFEDNCSNGPARKETFEVERFVRDSEKVKHLKNLYQNKCQICDYTFEYKKDKFYSEVHHYNPLKANADDDIDNMIVVCSNHHAQFDYNFIVIDKDGKTIRDRLNNKIAQIKFHKDHRLNIKNIQSQLEK